jgi:hypothetical protein
VIAEREGLLTSLVQLRIVAWRPGMKETIDDRSIGHSERRVPTRFYATDMK